MKNKLMFIIAILLMCLVGCNDEETCSENCDGDSKENETLLTLADELFENNRVYVAEEDMVFDGYSESQEFCRTLKVDGICGWRPPTLKELRSLIVDCSTTELGGTCPTGINEKAADVEIDYDNCGACRDESSTGCLFDSRLGLTDCSVPYWSSDSNIPSGPGWKVMVDFKTGGLVNGWAAPREGICHFEYGFGDLGKAICILDEDDRECHEAQEKVMFNNREYSVNEDIVESSDGLVWQKASTDNLNHSEAVQLCDALSIGEHDDWRLPTITELRSITEYCKHLQTGGSYTHDQGFFEDASCCIIADENYLGTDYEENSALWQKWCYCHHTDTESGCYWVNDVWQGGCSTAFWSDSAVSDKSGYHWVLHYGDVSTRETQSWEGSQIADQEDSQKLSVRCVIGTVAEE